jgi:hypothetical protein
MGLGSDLLNLRRNRVSSVATLISGIERAATAQSQTTAMMRAFVLNDLADAVLANVAVYALESYWGDALLPKARRAMLAPRRKSHYSSATQFQQPPLFA